MMRVKCIFVVALIISLSVVISPVGAANTIASSTMVFEGALTCHSGGVYGTCGKIAFSSNQSGNNDIYTMNVDGSKWKRLTRDPAADVAPRWSPFGERIVFWTDRDGNREIYVMDADGKNLKNLTNHPASDVYPDWSPDGTKIVFQSYRDDGENGEIYVMDVDGNNVKRLTKNHVNDVYPRWSPDGKKIAFYGCDGFNCDIYIMNADGNSLMNVTDNSAYDGTPAWSPDGTKIAFSSDRDGNREIYVMDVDGKNVKRLTKSSLDDYGPHWSPDGKRILFHSADEDFEIRIINADGSDLRFLTDNSVDDTWPAWSPCQITKAILLANEIDYTRASDLIEFLNLNGYEVVHITAGDITKYRTETLIIILGGADARDGVGDIVKHILNDEEEELTRQKICWFLKKEVWAANQRIFIFSGRDRDETAEAHTKFKREILEF